MKELGYLHRVDTSQLGERDGVSVGGCCNHDCNEGRDCPQRDPVQDVSRFVTVLFVIAICVVAFSPEIAAAIHAYTK
jgi:hypothetical protein